MKVTDFIVEKAELLAELMTRGPVQINKNETGDFSQLVWVIPAGLTYHEFLSIDKHGLRRFVIHQDQSLTVWAMYLDEDSDVHHAKNPISACSNNE